MIFPLSKSAPLACCAFMILSVSSRRIGMKRRAIDIIIATSWTGTFSLFRGWSSFSIPSVSRWADVVNVIMEDPATRYISRIAINTDVRRPPSVIVKIQKCISVSPVRVRSRFIITVNSSRITTGFNPFTIYFKGTFDSRITVPR